MGCITSKAITRSMSIREELRQGLHSRSAASAWEELLTSHSHSHSGNDGQLLAFVCPSNLKSSSTFTLPSSTDPPTNTINAETASDDVAQFTRSKSCHTPREKDMLMPAVLDGKRSLSFHTVEEYDALLLERIHLEEEEEGEGDDEPTCLAEDEEESCNASVETGRRRKAVARGLKTLDVSPVEFPAVARRRQWMVEQGHIYSPGTYVTPKFGSYNAPSTTTMPQNETKQDAVFSPELIAAFEDCMQQLQVEEDTILRHIDMDDSSNMYKPIDL